jgi:hypothetical protein
LFVESQVQNSPFVVYLLDFSSYGTYVGMSSDFMTRWDHHQNSAYNNNYTGTCNDSLKEAIKRCPAPNFYVIALADSKEKASDLEALAIKFYEPTLNSQPEYSQQVASYSFAKLNKLTKRISIESKRNHGNNYRNQDNDRDMCLCEVVWNKSKLRVQVTEGVHKGLFVECSKAAREEHAIGTKVKVKAALKSTGKSLVAATSARLVAI